MSGATGATGAGGATGVAGDAEAFAELLRGLKDRSGLSYGALAKRLHMSRSTLHRYCNGSAVPPDYAPAERLARVCRATPDELVELHRRWILADAARKRKGPGPVKPPKPDEPAPGAAPDGELPEAAARDEPVADDTTPPVPTQTGRRRTALIASVATAAVLGGLVLAVNLSSSGDEGEGRWAGDVTVPAITSTTGTATATGTGRAKDKRPSESASSASPSPSRGVKTGEPSAPAPDSAARGGGGATAERPGGVPVTVATRPYVYDNPCSQHFLVDAEPGQVGPPAAEQDAPRWAAANGAVSSGEQRVALTVQGTGKATVVLESLHVRVVAKGAPLAWNDYAMGVGCGGGVDTASFDVDLDKGSPAVTVKNGQRDFPYKVSESDPEVFYVTARTTAHDVRWDLELTWSSGDRHGTVHIDNKGAPFRTSADAGRPGYDYPPGSSEWSKRPE